MVSLVDAIPFNCTLWNWDNPRKKRKGNNIRRSFATALPAEGDSTVSVLTALSKVYIVLPHGPPSPLILSVRERLMNGQPRIHFHPIATPWWSS